MNKSTQHRRTIPRRAGAALTLTTVGALPALAQSNEIKNGKESSDDR